MLRCTSLGVYLALPAVQGVPTGTSPSMPTRGATGLAGLTQPLFINTAGRVLALPRQLTPHPAPIVSGSLLGGLPGVPSMSAALGEADSLALSRVSLDATPPPSSSSSQDGSAPPMLTSLAHLHTYSLPSPSDLPSPALGPLPLGDLGLGLTPSPENWPHRDPSSGELPISKGNKVYMCTFFHFCSPRLWSTALNRQKRLSTNVHVLYEMVHISCSVSSVSRT